MKGDNIMIDIDKIMKALPHRYPFLLVDRILEVGENRVVGSKTQLTTFLYRPLSDDDAGVYSSTMGWRP